MTSDYYDPDGYDDIAPTEYAPFSPYRAYLAESRAPLTGLIFTLPLFAAYHLGLWWTENYQGQSWVNAADAVIARALGQVWAGPLLSFLLVLFAFFFFQIAEGAPWRIPRPGTFGMMVGESLVFAVPVILLNGVVDFIRSDWAAPLQAMLPAGAGRLAADAAAAGADVGGVAAAGSAGLSVAAKVALSCGAGVYEEFLFRLVLMGGMALLLRSVFGFRGSWVYLAAALVQALSFSAFHHLPGSIEPFSWGIFTFRTVAGVYFAYLYWERGFGIAAGAHAGYDLFTVATTL